MAEQMSACPRMKAEYAEVSNKTRTVYFHNSGSMGR
jgi:hypothetical protein